MVAEEVHRQQVDALRQIRAEADRALGMVPAVAPAVAEEPAPAVDDTPGRFQLGRQSLARLEGVHSDLVRVVRAAIEITPVDFTVLEGVRSRQRQAELLRTGASRTMDSRHLTGHAVDLGAFVDGQVRWDWPLYIRIAEAVRRVSMQLDIPIRWGGCWDLLSNHASAKSARDSYRGNFPDGPHFELPRGEAYP